MLHLIGYLRGLHTRAHTSERTHTHTQSEANDNWRSMGALFGSMGGQVCVFTCLHVYVCTVPVPMYSIQCLCTPVLERLSSCHSDTNIPCGSSQLHFMDERHSTEIH